MWTQLPYLLQMQVSLTLMWLFYRLVQQRDVRLSCSRFFLLAAVPVSLLLPLLDIPVFPGAEIVLPVSLAMLPAATAEAANAAGPAAAGFGPGFFLLLGAAAGSAALGFVAVLNILPWLRLMRGPVQRVPACNALKVIHTPAVETACTFFGYVFVNRERLRDDRDLYPVLAHEMAHVRLRHSWDLALAELFRILFWWNPFVWLWYRSLREVHEFQADRHVLAEGYPAEKYINLMIAQFSDAGPAFVSGFSYSLIKKRIMMLATGKPRRWARLRVLLAIPLLGVLMTLFSFTERDAVLIFPETFTAEWATAGIPELPAIEATETQKPIATEPEAFPASSTQTSDMASLLVDTLKMYEHMHLAREALARVREDSARIRETERQMVFVAKVYDAAEPDREITEEQRRTMEEVRQARQACQEEMEKLREEMDALNHEMKVLVQEARIEIKGVALASIFPADPEAPKNPDAGSIDVKGDPTAVGRLSLRDEGNQVRVITKENAKNPEAVTGTVPFRNGPDALVVVDGVVQEEKVSGILSRINSQDVESIRVMKDGSDTVIYGQRAKNGVIYITTKKKTEKTPEKSDVSQSMILTKMPGISTLDASKALVVIDEVEQQEPDAYNRIDPQDIESITVLKDAAATKPYGSRGKNGVILITTKKSPK